MIQFKTTPHRAWLTDHEPAYPPYHSPAWWDMVWKEHNAWREGTYPAAAGTGLEVTPVTGVSLAD